MHQGRQRHMSQGLLDLKRLYWNCRVFREGKRKGKSPYDLLGLHLPSSNWWQLLQMAPEELAQKLLTQPEFGLRIIQHTLAALPHVAPATPARASWADTCRR